MLPVQIIQILNLFDICGFNSGSSYLTESKKSTYVIYFVHISVVVILSLFEFQLMTIYFPSLGLSEAISESLQYSAALYTYWLIILDSILHRRSHQNYWKVLQQIDEYFSCQPKCVINGFMMKFGIYYLKTILIMVIRLIISSFVGFSVDFAYICLFIICELRMFYYLFCLEILHFQLKMVEEEVKTMMKILNLNTIREHQHIDVISACYTFEMQRLKWIRGYFHCVYKMMYLLNEIFGWSHVAGISFCFYYILTESNWFYIHFHAISFVHRIGESFFILRSCDYFILQTSSAVVFATILHWQLLIFYLFRSATNCSVKVRFLKTLFS